MLVTFVFPFFPQKQNNTFLFFFLKFAIGKWSTNMFGFFCFKRKKKRRKKENLAYYLCIPVYPLFLEWEKLFGIAILKVLKKKCLKYFHFAYQNSLLNKFFGCHEKKMFLLKKLRKILNIFQNFDPSSQNFDLEVKLFSSPRPSNIALNYSKDSKTNVYIIFGHLNSLLWTKV